MFGYHVHEKAILMVTVHMALAAADSQWNARQYFVLSTVGHVALMPLLFTEQEYPIKVSIDGCCASSSVLKTTRLQMSCTAPMRHLI